MKTKFALCCLLVTFSGFANAQTLPKAWWGVWSGNCQNRVPGQQIASNPFELELKIEPQTQAKLLSWTMTYTSQGNSQKRPYFLKTKAAEQGHFMIDEGGGVLLDTFLVDNILTAHFEFPGSTLLTTRDELDGDTINSEIMSFSGRPIRSIGSEGASTIKTYQLKSLQRCKLYRRS